MPDLPSKGDQARTEILEAAKQLFLSQGYNGTSMRDIARAAGNRAVAGIYNYFPTKQAIFEALIHERNPYGGILNALEAGQGDTAPEYIHNVLTTILQFMVHHYDFVELAQIDLRELEGQTIKQVLQEEMMPRIVAVIARVQTLPGLRPVEGFLLMRLFASVVIGFITTERLISAEIFEPLSHYWSRETWAEKIANAILYGIAEQ
jgi:AcrR family transcriptional regulator